LFLVIARFSFSVFLVVALQLDDNYTRARFNAAPGFKIHLFIACHPERSEGSLADFWRITSFHNFYSLLKRAIIKGMRTETQPIIYYLRATVERYLLAAG
jgi:hypothetical protein